MVLTHLRSRQRFRAGVFVAIWLVSFLTHAAVHRPLPGPAGSSLFGVRVQTLPNGNLVVVETAGGLGTVHLYSPLGERLGSLRGSNVGDEVGSGGVEVLPSGHFLVFSPNWRNGDASQAGAVTRLTGTAFGDVVVSPDNSLVGSSRGDRVGMRATFAPPWEHPGFTALPDGSLMIVSQYWKNGTAESAGAVTFSDTGTFTLGEVSQTNSIVGSQPQDGLGISVHPLTSGNIVVMFPYWDHGSVLNAGAAVFVPRASGRVGPIGPANALIGTHPNDAVGAGGFYQVGAGNYLVASHQWNKERGAVTWGSGSSGIVGEVDSSNSLVGGHPGDRVGDWTIEVSAGGAYLIRAPDWQNGSVVQVGAATKGMGDVAVTGVVGPSNSLVGSSSHDRVGEYSSRFLSDGTLVVLSPSWDSATSTDAGAMTVIAPGEPAIGLVAANNSCIGGTSGARIGSNGFLELPQNRIALLSPNFEVQGQDSVGAITIKASTSPCVGNIGAANSLLGSNQHDALGFYTYLLPSGKLVMCWRHSDGPRLAVGACKVVVPVLDMSGVVTPIDGLFGMLSGDGMEMHLDLLDNGDYVFRWPYWGNPEFSQKGAIIPVPASNGVTGAISDSNALIGTSMSENLGVDGLWPLPGGRFIVTSKNWANGSQAQAGAVVYFDGVQIAPGSTIGAGNALIGTHTSDQVGGGRIEVTDDGTYLVTTPSWDSATVEDAGAISMGSVDVPALGPIGPSNSVPGETPWSDHPMSYSYDPISKRLAVGMPGSNQVIWFSTGAQTQVSIEDITPSMSVQGQSFPVVVSVTTTASEPNDGEVVVRASTGERCVATNPEPQSSNVAHFQCDITIETAGPVNLAAWFQGSHRHAFSSDEAFPHLVISASVFLDGFEE